MHKVDVLKSVGAFSREMRIAIVLARRKHGQLQYQNRLVSK